jgi:hypothetical protein
MDRSALFGNWGCPFLLFLFFVEHVVARRPFAFAPSPIPGPNRSFERIERDDATQPELI